MLTGLDNQCTNLLIISSYSGWFRQCCCSAQTGTAATRTRRTNRPEGSPIRRQKPPANTRPRINLPPVLNSKVHARLRTLLRGASQHWSDVFGSKKNAALFVSPRRVKTVPNVISNCMMWLCGWTLYTCMYIAIKSFTFLVWPLATGFNKFPLYTYKCNVFTFLIRF